MHKLVVFVPDGSEEPVKEAAFAVGAGHLGHYSRCAWQTLGTGQFYSEATADPAVGAREVLTRVAEWRIEILVPDSILEAVVQAVHAAHPYEEPAYELIPLAWPRD